MSQDFSIPTVFSPGAALGGYVQIVYGLYMEDRLDVALRAAHDAFESTGWPAGGWTEFYNTLVCETEARDASAAHRIDDMLTIEIPRSATDAVCDHLRSAALEARQRVGELLEIELKRPCLVAVLLPDAPLEFISASYGYAVRKNDLGKICVPWDQAQSRQRVFSTLLHEFTHVACYELVGRKQLPRWLSEGLALYVCGDASHERCRQLVESDAKFARLLSIDRLEAALSSVDLRKDDPQSVSAAYSLAGSLVAWWAEKKGDRSVRDAVALIGNGWSPYLAVFLASRMWVGGMVRGWRKQFSGLTNS